MPLINAQNMEHTKATTCI